MEMQDICQSCAMPLQSEEDLGTNKDGSRNFEYCKFCFKNGEFTNPEFTLEDMIEHVARIAVEKLDMPEEEAIEMAQKTIPSLNRWKKPED